MSMEWIPNGRFADCDGERINARVEEDARLIAAAPSLYEALEELAMFHESGGHSHNGDPEGLLEAARQALSLARGELR